MKEFSSIFTGEENISNELLKLSEQVRSFTGGLKVNTYIPSQNLENISTKTQSFSYVHCDKDGYDYALHSFIECYEGEKGGKEIMELSISVLQ